MKRIGLLFGSFDPIHFGHLAIAKAVWQTLRVDKIKLILTPQNPFKTHLLQTDVHHRKKMLELAIASLPYLELDLIELSLPPPHYTFKTLRVLQTQYPNDELYFVMGGDSFRSLSDWEEYEWILQHTTLVVYERDEHNPDKPIAQHREIFTEGHLITNQSPPSIIFLNSDRVTLLPVSSTLIREQFKMLSRSPTRSNHETATATERKSIENKIREWLPHKVKNYIFKNQLYIK